MDRPLPPRPWYMRHLSKIVTGVLFLGFTLSVSVKAFGPRTLSVDAQDHQIVAVSESPFMEYVNVEGIVQPIQTIQVNTLEGGYVERIVAEEGSMLEVGDTILIISNPELLRTIDDEHTEWQNQQRNYQEQEIEMAKNSLTLRQQMLDAHHQMASQDKKLEQSREEYEMGIKSKAEMEVMEEEYRYQRQTADLQMQRLRHDSVASQLRREMLESNRRAAERKLLRTAKRTDNLVVRATVAGQLSFLKVGVGQQVGAGTPVGEIKVMSEYKVHTQLSEYYIDRITAGLPANIQQDEAKFPMRISKVVPEVKERTFPCDLVFTGEKPSNIRLGKSYRVNIELGRPEKAIVIPRGDFFATTQGRWLYKLDSDGRTARRVNIEIGRQNPQQYEVISGLKPGDRVLVSGYSKLGEAEELTIDN